ncbi:uncharacterized protein LOC119686224 [Teleopsis dalmanni]|uniref:uncharacterized protein LOC119686224 n=1 Tax=Teleopsis dalmanni TaxID=139649 RepID=UPI0018CE0DAD|nr:uncharacterized protein LOC119686224 [Teleopsis dalmanni]
MLIHQLNVFNVFCLFCLFCSQVTNESSLARYNNTVHKHGLITSTLGLQLTVEPSHFHDGAMRVKCLASISPVLWKGNKESVLQRRPGIINNREAMLLVRSATSSIHQWNNLSCWRLLTITAILTMTCQLLLRRVLT